MTNNVTQSRKALTDEITQAQKKLDEINAEFRKSEICKICNRAREAWLSAQRGIGKARSLLYMATQREQRAMCLGIIRSILTGDQEGSAAQIGLVCPEYQMYMDVWAKRAEARMSIPEFRKSADMQQAATLKLINLQRNCGKKTIVFMAPYFSKSRLSDGYFQRVQAIDDLFGEDLLAVYCSWLDSDEDSGLWRYTVWDERHIEISFPQQDEVSWIRVQQIIHAAGIVYHHSITFADERITCSPSLLKIVDLHGAYPEELRMYGRTWRARQSERQEQLAVKNAQYILCVSNQMLVHIRKKYCGNVGGKYIILPILKQSLLTQEKEFNKPYNGIYEVVYAGGMQKWQGIKEMRNAICKAQGDFFYRICTAEPQKFLLGWSSSNKPKNMQVQSLTPQEMTEVYHKAHFGFVLRKDDTINRVSCPTKLMEYIAMGVVPILKSIYLGDFVSEGMQYVSLENFIAGRLPQPQQRDEMARTNYNVLMLMNERFLLGATELKKVISGGE